MPEPNALEPSSKPLLHKLGVKPGMHVAVVGLDDAAFVRKLSERGCEVVTGAPRGESHLIFLHAKVPEGLVERLGRLEPRLKRDGAIWVIRPKGTPGFKEVDVIEAGKRAGLVDNKIASFSDSLSAMRLVIPVARR
jgi:hypothetical protein